MDLGPKKREKADRYGWKFIITEFNCLTVFITSSLLFILKNMQCLDKEKGY